MKMKQINVINKLSKINQIIRNNCWNNNKYNKNKNL